MRWNVATVLVLLVMGVGGGVGITAQTSRDACLLPGLTVASDPDSAVRVAWTPSGRPLQTHLSTRWVETGLTTTTHIDPNTTDWHLRLLDSAHTVHEIRQVVRVDTLRLLTTAYIEVDRRRVARGFQQRTAVVITDHATATELDAELARYHYDLLCEGWVVRRITVPSTIQPRDLKQRILSAVRSLPADGDPTQIHVVLVGDLPYASSGGYNVNGAIPNPDYHPEHGGAWASDAYYADVETSPGIDAEYQWTDTLVTIVDTAVAQRPENRNVPGDGTFDQSVLPSDLELCVGRIDMRDLPAMGSPLPLLRRYFDKNHQYRTRSIVAPYRALIDDNFGVFTRRTSQAQITEAFAASAWRSFSVIVGPDNVFEGDWITDRQRLRPSLDSTATLLAYGCGGGGYEHCSGVATTQELAATPILSVFTLLFGSYFGDVASTNNLMRATLAADGWTLACGWSGRPHWFLHPLAAGATIGECQRLTANNSGQYVGAAVELLADSTHVAFPLGLRNIHVLLLGDPTLRLQGPTIPGELTVTPASDGQVRLSWPPSTETGHDSPWQVAYMIEGAEHLDSVFTLIDTIAHTHSPSWQQRLPSTVAVVRVRPYFTSMGRLAPLPGRGLVKHLLPLTVSAPVSAQIRRWIVCDLQGRLLLDESGPDVTIAEWIRHAGSRLPVSCGPVIVTNGNSTAVLRISP